MPLTDEKRTAIEAKIQRLQQRNCPSTPKRKEALQKRVDALTAKLSS